DRANDWVAKRRALERRDVAAEVIADGGIVEDQVDVRKCGAAKIDKLEGQISNRSVKLPKTSGQQSAPDRTTLVGLVPGELEFMRSLFSQNARSASACRRSLSRFPKPSGRRRDTINL